MRPTTMHATAPHVPRGTLSTALAATLILTLSACGGGGSDTDTSASSAPTTPIATSSLPQGRWASTGITPAYTAIVVPNTTGANLPAVDTVWALAQDVTTLVKLQVNGAAQTAGAVTGNVYALGTAGVTAVSGGRYTLAAGTPPSAAPQMSLQPLLGTTVLFDRSDAMATALKAEQANGRWQADLGTVKVSWTVQSAQPSATTTPSSPNVGGTSTTGCTYSGSTRVVAAQSLYRVQFTETCPGTGTATTQTFNGVATLSPDEARLTVVATNESEARATALLFVRQP
jgi:hypothetical protein